MEKNLTLCFRIMYDVLFQYLLIQVNFRMKTSSQKSELKQFIVKLSKQNIRKKNNKKLLTPPFFSISPFNLTFCRVLGPPGGCWGWVLRLPGGCQHWPPGCWWGCSSDPA